MALVAYEGFDHYSTATDAILGRRGGGLQWNSGGVGFLSPGRNGSGLAVGVGQNSNIQGALTVPIAAGYLGFGTWVQNTIYPGNPRVELSDLHSTNNVGGQLRFTFNGTTGGIDVSRGPAVNYYDPWVVIGSTVNNAFTVGAWNFIEIYFNIASSGGALQIRSNGQIVMDLTGIDTQSASHASWDGITFFGPGAPTGTTLWIDDLYLADTTVGAGLFPMNYFLGDIRVVTLHAIADYGTPGWVSLIPPPSPHRFWRIQVNDSPGNYGYHGAIGEVQFRNVAGVSQPLTGGTASATGGAAADAADNNPATYFDFITSSPYWWQYDFGAGNVRLPAEIAITCSPNPAWSPQNFTLLWSDDGASFFVAGQYTSAAWTSGGQTQTFRVGTGNWQMVTEARADGDATYNSTATPGATDRFTFEHLGPTVSNVLAIQITGSYRKDDAGTRIVTQLVNSAGTEVGGTGFSVPNSYVYCSDLYTTDPATGAAWTAAAVNALKVGYTLTS